MAMSTLTIRQLDEETKKRLRVMAATSGRSMDAEVRKICGDARSALSTVEPNSFNCAITSPPYYSQRDYEVEGQIGLESSIDEYVQKVVRALQPLQEVLRKDGTLFLNLGDTYYSGKGQPKGNDRKQKARRFGLRPVDASGLGVPRKTTIGIPWRVALGMIDQGWTLRCPVIWHRTASVPEPTAKDRPWRTYETVFIFANGPKYFFDRSKLESEEDIWTISARPRKGKHTAAFPDELVEKCLSVGCPQGGKVIDPFAGSGTVLRVAAKQGISSLGIDLNPNYCQDMIDGLSHL